MTEEEERRRRTRTRRRRMRTPSQLDHTVFQVEKSTGVITENLVANMWLEEVSQIGKVHASVGSK